MQQAASGGRGSKKALDEAMESATAQVSKVSDGGSVLDLLVKNLGEQDDVGVRCARGSRPDTVS